VSDSKSTVTQSHAKAGGDNVGRDKTTIGIVNNNQLSSRPGTLERLMDKLAAEIHGDVKTREQIDTLQHYYGRRSHDGIHGLEEKLKHSGRHDEILDAFEKKELFVKLLNRFSLYSSAQEIFAYLLSRAERRFKISVFPSIDQLSPHDIDELISTSIVEPLVAEVGAGVFSVNDAIIMGMVYWLAEQCFIRWHA
jgi:hypothetical protein